MFPFTQAGRAVLGGLRWLGQITSLTGETVGSIFRGNIRWRLFFHQVVVAGTGSQLVTVVTGAFTGAVFTAQIYFQFIRFGVESMSGAVTSIALCRELGPVLTGLMVTGRVGAAMTAEIGTMKVTEQVDALRALGVHPVDYLVVPRFLALVVSMPFLIAEAIIVGIAASWLLGTTYLNIPEAYFLRHLFNYTNLTSLLFGMIKGLIFGILIVLICCLQGLNTQGGAMGVGQATTRAVVISSLAILIFNFFLTLLLTNFLPI